jgi:glycosyltransferase involved in cell wall biosynthesis
VTRVLFLAYFFPPLGGPGTQRSVKLVRDLPDLGYEPVVVTGPGASTSQWDPEDDTLLSDIPAGVTVVRAEGSPPADSSRADRWLDRPPAFQRWWVDAAVRAARPHLDSVDVIYAGMSPYETAFAAARLADESGLPWMADLRDPWALDEMRVYPSTVHRNRDRARMRGVLASAHAVVMNTPEAVTALREAFPELGLKHITSIPNGFDSTDFPPRPASGPSANAPFRVVHTGSLHTALGLRHNGSRGLRRLAGGSEPVDILARSHVHLMAAVDLLRRTEPALARRLELHFAGVLTDEDRRVADGPGTHFHGYLDHPASVELVRSADLLFLPMHDLPDGQRARLVPGKTYEYLGSGRPILAAVPDGDARDLLRQVPHAHVCRPTDVAAMADALAHELHQTSRHGRRPDSRPELAARYERKRLSAELGRVLERIAPAPPQRRPLLKLVG